MAKLGIELKIENGSLVVELVEISVDGPGWVLSSSRVSIADLATELQILGYKVVKS